ncbi:MAG: hypothetical protein VZR10_03920 [Methanobrevibacter sp.]|nr:hypothetical protein [Methanobrevibacter sp.]
MILILIGIVIFSTITAAISSYLTDTMLENGDNGIDEVKKTMEKSQKTLKANLTPSEKRTRD